jgi:zona occludens toxin (predicted ATPase)
MPGTSVELITGKIGDGKTYHTLKYRLIPALKRGRHVFTNIDFGPNQVTKEGAIITTGVERFARAVSLYLDKDVREQIHLFKDESEIKNMLRLKDMEGKLLQLPRGATVIIDEAQMLWPAPIPGHLVPMDPLFIKWVAYVRHFDQELILITQSPTLVNKHLLGLMNENVRVKNMVFLSTLLGKQYRVTYHQSVWAEPHGGENHRFDPEIFKLYQSAMAYGVKGGRMLPGFMLLPLIGLIAWLLFMFFVGRKTPFLKGVMGSKSTETAATAVFNPSAANTSKAPETAPSRNLEAILAAIQQAENQPKLKDSPISLESIESDSPPKHVNFTNGLERGRKLWADPEYLKKHNIH